MARYLVTGGGGFLGLAVVRRLVARGDSVVSLSRTAYPALDVLGVAQVQGDLTDAEAVLRATEGVDAVFHVAAKAGVWGDARAFHAVNVTGTEHVLEACARHGVTRLIYTSSPSVVFDGTDQEGWDESAPYPTRFLTAYPETKAAAEQRVLAANGPQLATVSLRPHLIWGPGDNHLVPRIIARGKAGRIRIVGDPNKLVDSVYVDNAADAHLAACDRLRPGAAIAGKAYFITNGEPVPMQQLLNGILGAAGLPPVTRRVPASLAFAVGALMEAGYRLLGRREEPPLTRFVARQLATAHYYDISAARRDLDYRPAVTLEEGFRRLADDLNQRGT